MYLPLVRKYGVFHFDNIIGQPIVVKILKNSLFLDHLFPFYLFSGRHGCGKTSTARLFSAAINCKNIPSFQKDPSVILPCLSCESCLAMNRMQHPDFIEIDAASHTGVENIRTLIESATLLPLMGRKKIYLIDEAHMLSKAACNAFLKLLEEPPQHVIFILATTTPEKIIETVRSRAFQLLFHAISAEAMCEYITTVAQKESIPFTKEGIEEIVQRGGGSVRDTLHSLDQTHLAVSSITVETVQEVCGGISDSIVFDILHSIFSKNPGLLSETLQKYHALKKIDIFSLFEKVMQHSYQLLIFRTKQHSSEARSTHVAYQDLLTNNQISKKELCSLLLFLYDQELVIKRVENPILFLEIMLLKWIESLPKKDEESLKTISISVPHSKPELKKVPVTSHHEAENSMIKKNTSDEWDQFLTKIKEKQDPLLSSVFAQAHFYAFDNDNKSITVHFKKEQQFFASLLEEHKSDWASLLEKAFGVSAQLEMQFILEDPLLANQQRIIGKKPVSQSYTQVAPKESVSARSSYNSNTQQKRYYKVAPRVVDVSDEKKWPYAQRLQKIFHGIITEVEKT